MRPIQRQAQQYPKLGYADQTRFQDDFGEDLDSGEPLDEDQVNFIRWMNRWNDMRANEKGLYTPPGGWEKWSARTAAYYTVHLDLHDGTPYEKREADIYRDARALAEELAHKHGIEIREKARSPENIGRGSTYLPAYRDGEWVGNVIVEKPSDLTDGPYGPHADSYAYASRSAGIQDNTYPQDWMDDTEQLARETGGFTIHDVPGDAPETGYQVAIPGHVDDAISTGAGWADYGRRHQDILVGPDRYMGTWFNPYDHVYETEPSERIPDYNDAGRATLDRDQWSMWDNSAFVVDPHTHEKHWPMVSGPYGEDVPRAEITREQIADEGPASALGFYPRARRLDL